jgi:hypothetical protein
MPNCDKEAVHKIQKKYGAGENDFDTYLVCESCRKLEKKDCTNWGYGWYEEILPEES